MATPPTVDSYEQYRRDFRTIFAETGQKTLNALLIVSGGAAVAYLTFLGGAIKEGDLAQKVGSDATKGFVFAMQWYVAGVACSVLSHGMTYFSHGAYHFRRDKAGNWFMGLAIACGVLCLVCFVGGSLRAIHAFEQVADKITQAPHDDKPPAGGKGQPGK